jgi:hypothetical protein
VDVSHRGGKPGFVRVDIDGGRGVLTIPDFRGNFMFNTLGNLAADPRAGLLLVGFEHGGTLQLSGRARIEWDQSAVAAYEGAERLVELTVDAVVEREGGGAVSRSSADTRPPAR